MNKFSIEFYTKENGKKPAKEFLLSVDKKMRVKLSGILNLMEEYGNQIGEPYSKHLEDGIFEVRGKTGNDISRVLYFFYFEGRIILTNGFVKKTQKTPRQEIELAKKYRKDFLERMVKNE